MKHIIIEGGDRLGKSTLIKGLVDHFNYDNVTIRHFGKPPKTIPKEFSPLDFQIKCFEKEGGLLLPTSYYDNDYNFYYYDNIVIWNRSHLGEFVYGQMFRNENSKEIEDFIKYFEKEYFINNLEETYLILLTADPNFFLKQEDGKSFSKNLEEKKKELKLFNEIFEKSIINKKLKIKVNDDNKYLPKEYILNSVLELIEYENSLLA